MNKLLGIFQSLPLAPKVLVACFAVAFPLSAFGHWTKHFELYDWLGLCPALVWKGEVWTLFTYALLPICIIDWAFGIFWLMSLGAVLGRDMSTWQFSLLSILSAVGGGVAVCIVTPRMQGIVFGNAAIIFALTAAFYRFHKNENLLLLGLGEWSVRQLAILLGLINVLVLLFTAGWLLTLCMIFGGGIGWLYLLLISRRALTRQGQAVVSERTARLEF